MIKHTDHYISFPTPELKNYQTRLNQGKIIYTTRVSDEVDKYQISQTYNSPLGTLKVISLKHFTDIHEHPFYDQLTASQIQEINSYITENGYDVIGLIQA